MSVFLHVCMYTMYVQSLRGPREYYVPWNWSYRGL